ncbi:MAG: hypothetical protein RH862_20330 [Leptospiraceae bacterium]
MGRTQQASEATEGAPSAFVDVSKRIFNTVPEILAQIRAESAQQAIRKLEKDQGKDLEELIEKVMSDHEARNQAFANALERATSSKKK